MIKINEVWSIEKHLHGGFNLHRREERGVSKKTGKPIIKTDSFYYPKLEMCAAKMVEEGFDNDAEDLEAVFKSINLNANALCHCLQAVFNKIIENADET